MIQKLITYFPTSLKITNQSLKNPRDRDEIPGTIGRGNLSTEFPGTISRRDLSTIIWGTFIM